MSGLSAEKINRTVAYQFLDQIKKQNQPEEDDPQDIKNTKVVFKKPTRAKETNSDTVKKPASEQEETEGSEEQESAGPMVGVSSGGKRAPSESECGSRTNKQPKVRTKASVALSHLDECND